MSGHTMAHTPEALHAILQDAITHARWELHGTANDGTHIHLNGRGTIVSRRKPDGTWKIVLDDPMSPE